MLTYWHFPWECFVMVQGFSTAIHHWLDVYSVWRKPIFTWTGLRFLLAIFSYHDRCILFPQAYCPVHRLHRDHWSRWHCGFCEESGSCFSLLCALWHVRRQQETSIWFVVALGAVWSDRSLLMRSFSTVLLPVSLGLPLFLLLCGVHRRAALGFEFGGMRHTSPAHLLDCFC